MFLYLYHMLKKRFYVNKTKLAFYSSNFNVLPYNAKMPVY